jgi:hypothetical protein
MTHEQRKQLDADIEAAFVKKCRLAPRDHRTHAKCMTCPVSRGLVCAHGCEGLCDHGGDAWRICPSCNGLGRVSLN